MQGTMWSEDLRFMIYDMIANPRGADTPSLREIIAVINAEDATVSTKQVLSAIADLLNKDYIRVQTQSKNDKWFTLGSRRLYPQRQMEMRNLLSEWHGGSGGLATENPNVVDFLEETVKYNPDLSPSVRGTGYPQKGFSGVN